MPNKFIYFIEILSSCARNSLSSVRLVIILIVAFLAFVSEIQFSYSDIIHSAFR